MTTKGIDFATVDLENCHREPIHIPGYIQPHGLLFALDFGGRLTHLSRGARSTFPGLPCLGSVWPSSPSGMHADLWTAVTAALCDAETGQEQAPLNLEVASGEPDSDDDAGAGVDAQAKEVVDAAPEVKPQVTAEAALAVSPKPVD